MLSSRKLGAILLAHAVVVATTVIAPDGPSDAQDPTAPFPRKGEYASKELCRDCHEDEWEALGEAHHRDVLHSDVLLGCETCHGPGKAHADDDDNDPKLITHPPSLVAAKQTAVCAQCHADQIAGHGGDAKGFLIAGKGCTACHKVHREVPETPHAGTHFKRRAASESAAEPVDAAKCAECHPLRKKLLADSHHSHMASAQGCTRCHGNGSLHVETGGLARLITRPDRAGDGAATCRSCHEQVHPTRFHWKDKRWPLLSEGLTCTSCHVVHEPEHGHAPSPVSGSPHSSGSNAGISGRGRTIDPATGEALGAIDRRPLRGLAESAPTNQLCAKCHAPAFDVLVGTIHASLGGMDTPLAIGCGSCHAGAEQHARRGGLADLVDSLHGSSAEHQRKTCATCHGDEPSLRHHRVGSHHRHEVTCLSCHSPAAPAGKVRHDAESSCAKCHTAVAAEFKLPNHHPVPEGHMGCSDCHNPHDARPRLRDRKLREQSCVQCHKQYRGPFVFAHQTSRSDGCVVCHSPHGTSNRRMLKQHSSRQNCLQCHADYPAFHDQTQGAVFTNCLQCHTEVHGSNHSRFLFR